VGAGEGYGPQQSVGTIQSSRNDFVAFGEDNGNTARLQVLRHYRHNIFNPIRVKDFHEFGFGLRFLHRLAIIAPLAKISAMISHTVW
jgi:hypothetical protein